MTANGDTLERLSVWLRTESPTHAPEGVNRMMDLVAAEIAEVAIAVKRIRLAARALTTCSCCASARKG